MHEIVCRKNVCARAFAGSVLNACWLPEAAIHLGEAGRQQCGRSCRPTFNQVRRKRSIPAVRLRPKPDTQFHRSRHSNSGLRFTHQLEQCGQTGPVRAQYDPVHWREAMDRRAHFHRDHDQSTPRNGLRTVCSNRPSPDPIRDTWQDIALLE